ncbi:MAG: hypothetical protein CUN55_14890, partial [Phototrophicales bacterium]
MLSQYFENPILATYYYPRPSWGQEQIAQDLKVFSECDLRAVWLFYDPFYDIDDSEGLRYLLDSADAVGLQVVPVLGQFTQLQDDLKIVNVDGTTSDDPRYWNMGCFRKPRLLNLAIERAARFLKEFGTHSSLYRIDDKPVMSFVHEAYYRNSVPEFGGDEMKPNCYCDDCRAAFKDYLKKHGMSDELSPPVDTSDPILWQHWINFHAESIPLFLKNLIAAAKAVMPLWATHECNDFYPASWQSVYTGNDWWEMGAVLDFGHEDMYPLEFDNRYQCYVYNYAKDIMKSALGFQGLITANGQAFNSWLGYQLPSNSMSEQIYSALGHGALGLVWWTELPSLSADDEAKRYHMIRQTKQVNRLYLDLVKRLSGYTPASAEIALLYSWTTMAQSLNDEHTYDTLLVYMLLTQSGYPVDIVSEKQVSNGILAERHYKAVFALGCSALPSIVQEQLTAFAENGGILFVDYAPYMNDAFQPLFPDWRNYTKKSLRTYEITHELPVTVQLAAAALIPPEDAEVFAYFNDKSAAIFRTSFGHGAVFMIGSYIGWDYSNYPGNYDLAKMFPFYIRRDYALREYLVQLLTQEGIC